MHSHAVFPIFSPHNREYNPSLQIQFTLFGLIAQTVTYSLVNIAFDNIWKISPMYVGSCFSKENKNWETISSLAAAHILSDVLLGLVFGMVGGVYSQNTHVRSAVGVLDAIAAESLDAIVPGS